MVFSAAEELIKTCHVEKGSLGTRIMQEFPGKRWNCRSVDRVIQLFKRIGPDSLEVARSEANKDYTEDNIQSQDNQPGTHKSQRKIGNAIAICQTSVHRITKELNLKAYKRIRVSRRDETVKQKRKTRSKNLDKRFTKNDVERMFFTDEKDFTIEVARNRQNDLLYGHKKKEIPVGRLYHETSQFSKKVMASAGVSRRGKTRIRFIDTSKTKVNSECYIKLLDENLLQDSRTLYQDNDFIFQQDGAPSHTSRITQKHLDANTPEFIGKDDWPPQSPDLNLMDYHVWDSLSEKVYEGRSTKFTERELKQKIQQSWEQITQGEIRKAIASWKKRVRAVCRENGGPTDHLFK